MATTRVMKTLAPYRQEGKDGLTWDRDPGEESGQDYLAGAPLVRDGSSGEIEEWAGGTNASLIVGVAAKDCSGTASTDVPYYEANDYNLFEGSLINGTDDHTLVVTNIGTAYSLIEASGAWYIDIGDTTTKVVTVVGVIDPVGDINARVICRFIQANQGNVL